MTTWRWMGLRCATAIVLAACGGGDKPVAAKSEALAPAQPAAPVAAPAQPAAPAEKPVPDRLVYPKPGFTKFALLDEQVPLCLFADHEAWQKVDFLDQVEKPKLKAGQPLHFGAFAPGCVSEHCDDRPMLQCRLELDDKTITIHAKYSGAHKDGSTCTEGCRKITASCNTKEALPAGTYTVRYGDQSKQVKIPSTPKEPCMGPRAK